MKLTNNKNMTVIVVIYHCGFHGLVFNKVNFIITCTKKLVLHSDIFVCKETYSRLLIFLNLKMQILWNNQRKLWPIAKSTTYHSHDAPVNIQDANVLQGVLGNNKWDNYVTKPPLTWYVLQKIYQKFHKLNHIFES